MLPMRKLSMIYRYHQSVFQDDIDDVFLLMLLMMHSSLSPNVVEEYPSC
jgi:hypothetical protein